MKARRHFMGLGRLYSIIRPFKGRMTLLLLITLAASCSEALGLAMIMPLLGNFLSVSPPDSAGAAFPLRLLYELLPSDNQVAAILGLLLALTVVKAVLSVLNNYMSAHFVGHLTAIWTKRIFDRYLSFPYAMYATQRHGDLLNNLIQEPNGAALALFRVIDFLVKLCLCLVMYATIVAIDWRMTLLLSAAMVLLIMPLNFLLKRRAQALGKERLALSQQLSTRATESIGGFLLVKALGLEALLSKHFDKINTRLMLCQIRGRTITALISPSMEVSIVFILVLMLYVMTGFDKARLSAMLPQLATVMIIANRLMGHLSDMLGLRVAFNYVVPSLVLVHNLASADDSGEDVSRGLPFSTLDGDIVFEKLTFRYKPDEPLLENLEATLARGKTTAFIGPSGAGKSTLAALLLGLYQPTGGRVRVHERSLSEYSLASWRGAIGYVSQDTMLFNVSIRENIRLGSLDASDEVVERAAQAASIHDFIVSLPQGYDTLVGDRGIRLSGGQRQRLAIARAILRDPQLYIFDEATSALDHETEQAIQTFLECDLAGKTVVVIAHRLSTIRNADVIYRIEQGSCRPVAKNDLAIPNHSPGTPGTPSS